MSAPALSKKNHHDGVFRRDRPMQRCSIVVIFRFDAGPFFEQQSCQGRMGWFPQHNPMQRCSTNVISCLDVGSPLEQQSCRVLRRRLMQRCSTNVIFCLDVGPDLEQQSRHCRIWIIIFQTRPNAAVFHLQSLLPRCRLHSPTTIAPGLRSLT